MSFQSSYLATGIGSLPLTDEKQAVQFVLQHFPELPHWPQLPKRSSREHFIYQFLNPLQALKILIVPEQGSPYLDFNQPELTERLAAFYEIFLRADQGEDLDFFAIPQKAGLGFYAFWERLSDKLPGGIKAVKGQIAGPLSIGLNLVDQDRHPVYYHTQLKDVLIKTLGLSARWQARKLSSFQIPAIIFVDDPAVSAWGTATHIALSREEIIKDLTELIMQIKAEGALAGVHSCAGADWSIFIEAGFDLISFDAYNYFDSLLGFRKEIKQFVEQGGILAWGIVPTGQEIMGEDLRSLMDKLAGQQRKIIQSGLSKVLLRAQTMITPSCGTGLLPWDWTEKIYNLTQSLSGELQANRLV